MEHFKNPFFAFSALIFAINAANASEKDGSNDITPENNYSFCYYKNEKYSEGSKIPELKGKVCKKSNVIIADRDREKLIWEVDNDSKVPVRR